MAILTNSTENLPVKRLLLVLLVSTSISAMAAEAGRPTAAAISVPTLTGVKEVLAGKEQFSLQQKRCISSIPNDALADVIAPIAVKELDATKLAQYDSFFSSALGKRYLKAFSKSPSTDGFGGDSFTQLEIVTIKRTITDPALVAFGKKANVNIPGAPQDKLRALVTACL